MSKKSGVNLLFSYAIKIVKERGFGKGRFFFLRALLFPHSAVNWISFVDDYFKKIGFDSAPWDIVATPLRLCLSNHLNAAQRTRVLQDHYEILISQLSQEAINSLMLSQSLKLATLVGKSGKEYEFSLSYSIRYRREGMLTILMKDQENEGLILTSITFTFLKNKNGDNCLLIGGLQGVSDLDNGKEAIVKSTRDLNGLRPKYAVLNCVYAVASCFNVVEIIAVSEKNHPVKLTNKRRKRSFYAEYDVFWQELEGKLNADKNFVLPIPLPKRNLEDVPSKKKKDWIARHNHVQKIIDMTKVEINNIDFHS